MLDIFSDITSSLINSELANIIMYFTIKNLGVYNMRKLITSSILTFVFIFLTLSIAFSPVFAENDSSLYKTGLLDPTQAQMDWMKKNFKETKDINLNSIGKQRIINRLKNLKNKKTILEKIQKIKPAPLGQEVQSTSLQATSNSNIISNNELVGAMPTSVDNSKLKYFPPIRSQGNIGSCAAFSSVYYQFTYMNALARDWDAKNSDDSKRFSPKWTYNMINDGDDGGSWFLDSYDVILNNGAATWSDFPYDSNYRAWSTDANVWRNALNYRIASSGSVANLNTNDGLNNLKQYLNNGYIFIYSTYIRSWQYKTIKDDPSTSADNSFVGKEVCYAVNGTLGGHGMTLVGYDDNIWVDLNNNNSVDSDEKGAFRIANSWGTYWKDGGFTWVSYNAVKNGVFRNNTAYWITAKSSYSPKLLAQFTVNTKERYKFASYLGLSDQTQTSPLKSWYPSALVNKGGAYAFDGTTTACDGNFVLDYTQLLDQAGLDIDSKLRYYLSVNNNTAGNPTTLKSFKLINPKTNDIIPSPDAFPKSFDLGPINSFINYGTKTSVIAIKMTPPSMLIKGFNTNGGAVSVKASYSDGSTADVTANTTFTSNNSNIAFVRNAVLYSGNSIGDATITATFEGKNATCLVSVPDITIPVVSVSPGSGSIILPGSAINISASDPVGGISVIRYKRITDDKWLSVYQSSFTINAPVAEGSYILDVVAYDRYNNSSGVKGYSYSIKSKITSEVSMTPTSIIIIGTNVSGGAIKVVAKYTDTTTKDVTGTASFGSNNSNIAYVKEGSIFSGSITGTATITALYDAKVASCTVTVKQATTPVTGVTLNKTSATLNGGSSETLVAAVQPDNAANKNVTWSSSSPSVATVSSSGAVTAVAAGTATITATTQDGNKTATCLVTVSNIIFTVSPDSGSTILPGAAVSVSASCPTGISILYYMWNTDNAWRYSYNGSVTVNAPVSEGSYTLYVSTFDYYGKPSGIKTYSYSVKGNVPILTSLEIDPVTMIIEGTHKAGGTLKVSAVYSDGTKTNVSDLAVISSNNRYVTNASNCVVYSSYYYGTAIITASYQGKSAFCTVTVKQATTPVTGVTLNKTSATLNGGSSETLTAAVQPDNAANKNVTWSSSSPSVATVSPSGAVTAVAAGTATITVTTQDGNKVASCIITVSEQVTLTSLSISPSSSTIDGVYKKGVPVTVIATFSNGSTEDVTSSAAFSSSASNIAYVNSGVLYSYFSYGTATITASYRGKVTHCIVTVT